MAWKPAEEELASKRRRFSISIGVIAVLFTVYVIGAGQALYRQALNNSRNRLALLSIQLTEQTDNFFNNYVSLFIMLSELQATRTKDTHALNGLFGRLNNRFSEFENIAAVDEKGFFFASGLLFENDPPPDMSTFSFFEDVKNGAPFAVMEPHVGPISHELVTGVIVRLETGENDFDGVLGASIRLSSLTDRWVEFAEMNNIKLFCYRGDREVLFSRGVAESKLGNFFLKPTAGNECIIDNKRYLFLSTPLTHFEGNMVLLSEFRFSFFENFLTNPLIMAITAFFTAALGMLLFSYRREIIWLKLLMQKESLLSATQTFTKVGGWQWNMDTREMFWTEEVYRIHGFNAAEFEPGSTDHIERSMACYQPEDRLVVIEAFEKCKTEGQPYDLEFPFTTETGEKKWIRTGAQPEQKNGKILKIVGNIMDITDRKQAEAALRRSQEQLALAIGGSGIGLWDWKVQTGEAEINERSAEIIGYPLNELAHITIETWYELIHPEDLTYSKELLKKHFRGEIPSFECEVRVKHKRGHWVWILNCGKVAQWDTEGKPVRMTGTYLDITERKNLEANLQQAQKMEAIGTLAGGIAHDFNNALFPLLGFTEMLREDLPPNSPLQGYVKEILHAASRSKDLIKQILTFSRQGKQDLKPINLQPIVKEALKLLRSSIPTTIDIQQAIDAECGVVIADPTQIHQIVMNLATNAYHAMENTGGLLTVDLKQVRLIQDCPPLPELNPGEYALLSVSDTGTGIDKDILHKVFDPYFTTKEINKGTGLGLSVVQGIVKSCKGDILINSESDSGTAVHVYLPIATEQANDINGDRRGHIQGGTERILLVDDEESIVKMEKQMLERLGYRVTIQTGSVEALNTFKANTGAFDLVITDMTMPNMTGVQLIRKIRNIRPTIPVIICTGFSDQIDEEKSMSMGFQGYVMKPVIKRELAYAIRKVFDTTAGGPI